MREDENEADREGLRLFVGCCVCAQVRLLNKRQSPHSRTEYFALKSETEMYLRQPTRKRQKGCSRKCKPRVCLKLGASKKKKTAIIWIGVAGTHAADSSFYLSLVLAVYA